MEIIAIGHDVIEIDRIRQARQRYGQKFLAYVYTPAEQGYCLAQRNPYPSLAVRFAVKESVAKAFGPGIGAQLSWKSIATIHTKTGKPEVILDSLGENLMAQLGAKKILASLTHTQEIASAVVVLI